MDFQYASAAYSKGSQTSQYGSRRAFLIWPETWRMGRCQLHGTGEDRWRQWEGHVQGLQDKTESSAENKQSCLWHRIWLKGRREKKILPTVRVLNLRETTRRYPAWECHRPRTIWKPDQRWAHVTVEIPLQRILTMTMGINASDLKNSKETTLLLHQHQCTRSTFPRTSLYSRVVKTEPTRLMIQLVEASSLSTGVIRQV